MHYQEKVSNFNQLPVELHNMILWYWSMSDLKNYALMSKYNHRIAINVLNYYRNLTLENVKKRIQKKEEPFKALLDEKPSTKSYHYYIDHGNLLILIQQVGFEQSKQLLWHMLDDIHVAEKIVKNYKLIEMLLKNAVPYVKQMLEIFPELIPDILEKEEMCALFLQNADSKAYLSDLASHNFQAAICILSKQNIIKHLLSPAADQILAPSEYLSDIPVTLFGDNALDDFDELYGEAKEDINCFNPSNPLPATVDRYLQAIIAKCLQLSEEAAITCDANDYMQRSLCL